MQPISSKAHLLNNPYIPPRIKKEAAESKPRVRKKLQEYMVKHRNDLRRNQVTPRSESLVEKPIFLS